MLVAQVVGRLPAPGPRFFRPGPGRLHRLQQSAAAGKPGLCTVLHQKERLGLEELPGGSQRRGRPEPAGLPPELSAVCAAPADHHHLPERVLRHVQQTGTGSTGQVAGPGLPVFGFHLLHRQQEKNTVKNSCGHGRFLQPATRPQLFLHPLGF